MLDAVKEGCKAVLAEVSIYQGETDVSIITPSPKSKKHKSRTKTLKKKTAEAVLQHIVEGGEISSRDKKTVHKIEHLAGLC